MTGKTMLHLAAVWLSLSVSAAWTGATWTAVLELGAGAVYLVMGAYRIADERRDQELRELFAQAKHGRRARLDISRAK